MNCAELCQVPVTANITSQLYCLATCNLNQQSANRELERGELDILVLIDSPRQSDQKPHCWQCHFTRAPLERRYSYSVTQLLCFYHAIDISVVWCVQKQIDLDLVSKCKQEIKFGISTGQVCSKQQIQCCITLLFYILIYQDISTLSGHIATSYILACHKTFKTADDIIYLISGLTTACLEVIQYRSCSTDEMTEQGLCITGKYQHS